MEVAVEAAAQPIQVAVPPLDQCKVRIITYVILSVKHKVNLVI